MDIVAAAVLSLAGAATTFCSYQASVWGGHQATSFSRADEVRAESVKAATRAGQMTLIDVASFLAWLQAEEHGETKLERIVRERLRKEFRPAFDDWLKLNPLNDANAPPTPFAMPSYRTEELERAAELSAESQRLLAEGRYATLQVDRYVLNTVIFAMALLFVGVGQQFRSLPVQLVLLGIATMLLIVGVARISRLPLGSSVEVETEASLLTRRA
jgi:hypothetical protein